MKGNILIVDDKVKLCKSLVENFDQSGYQSFYATNRKKALSLFSRHRIHAVLLDIMLGEENGIEVLKELLLLQQNIPVIMITGYASIDTAVQSIKLGAFDYVTKPLDFDKLLEIVENALKIAKLSEENRHLKNRVIELSPRIITRNQTILKLCSKAKKLAATNLPILICGENGTGKEIIADFIHANSPRNARKMLKINCAAFPESLLDNELFGHEKGAYTGADSAFKGVFERADESSLFLDEIGDMPLTIQAKLLRALQTHEIRRLGGEHTVTVDVRFIAATNKDLETLIDQQKFRQDLLYRLNTAMLSLPPLRERKKDIPLLVEYFLSEYSNMNSTSVEKVSPAVLEKFLEYDWPGNVRELKNTVNYSAAISSKDFIDLEDLPPNFMYPKQHKTSENIREEMEKKLIIKMLQKAAYNKKKAAELLNMSRRTLYNKLEKYRIIVPK
jgi:DNA-binding NtrC family response regulator